MSVGSVVGSLLPDWLVSIGKSVASLLVSARPTPGPQVPRLGHFNDGTGHCWYCHCVLPSSARCKG